MRVGKCDEECRVRESGIEILKIQSIFLIVLHHVTNTLWLENSYVPIHDYIIDLTSVTKDIQQIALAILNYSGAFGNIVFFICSAWFLLESKRFNSSKWLFMLLDIWVVSMLILVVTYILRGGELDGGIMFQSILPTTFANNWYLTCYLLFLPIHPILNGVIERMGQVSLLRFCMVTLILYVGFNFIKKNLFFRSEIILWITLYFTIAYMKTYLSDSVNCVKRNVGLLVIGLLCHIGIVLLTNILGLTVGGFEHKLLIWNQNGNPFLIVIGIALFNLMRNLHFRSSLVNRVSKLSLLIYIIHENIILRNYYRPYMLNYVYSHFGYDYILFWVVLIAIMIFVISGAVSFIYAQTLERLVAKASEWLYKGICKIYKKLEDRLLKMY